MAAGVAVEAAAMLVSSPSRFLVFENERVRATALDARGRGTPRTMTEPVGDDAGGVQGITSDP